MKNRALIAKLAEKYDSFYLYDESCIISGVNTLKENFPQIEFLYSIKCNPNHHVLHSVFTQDFGADAASLGEVLLANEAGLTKDKIYYSAPGKTMEDIESAISRSILIADSLDEIKRIQMIASQAGITANIGIRINPDFSFCGNCGQPSKFGIDEEQAIEFIRNHDCKNVKITGIHVHLRSQELNTRILSDYYGKMLRLAEKFHSLCGELEYVNMGSGMGIQYSVNETPLDMKLLSADISSELDKFKVAHPNTKLIIETGRYAVGKSGVYVTKVVDRKVSRGKTYLILKNTLNGFIRPSLAVLVTHYAAQEGLAPSEPLFTGKDAFQFLTFKDNEPAELVTLAGNLCTATDVVAEDIMLPHLECGDCIAITNAGSYAAVLSPMQFATQEKPVEIFLTTDDKIIVG